MAQKSKSRLPEGSVGLGLRWDFVDALMTELPALDFLEIAPENYVGRGGYVAACLAYLRDRYPIVTHGLSLSLGGHDPFAPEPMRAWRTFLRDVEAPWHSDHLCFSSVDGKMLHDLLPLTFTEKTVLHVADRIRRAQDALSVPLAVENISFYVHPGKRSMTEGEFIAAVCEKADCPWLLDVNNAFVNAHNFGWDLDEWFRTVPFERVVQVHIAGHEWFEDPGLLVDTHGAPVKSQVFELLERVLVQTGPVPVLLERDNAVPALSELMGEIEVLRGVQDRAAQERARHRGVESRAC